MRQFKALICFTWLILIMMLGFATIVMKSRAADEILFRVDPATQTAGVGELSNVTIQIENVPSPNGAAGIELILGWNPSILTGISMEEVLFHSIMPESEWDNIFKLKHEINNTAGYMYYAYAFLSSDRAVEGGYAPITGNHTLATITFRGESTGFSAVSFLYTLVGDREANEIPSRGIGGVVTAGNPPPTITILSPQNNSYSTSPANLTVGLSEQPSWIGYSLDGNTNVSLTTNMIQMSEGQHTLVVYANDSVSGQMASSDITYFTVDATPPIASFTYTPQTPQAEIIFGTFRWKFNFSASASYDTATNISTYFWSFDDGTNTTGVAAAHEYRQSGTYNVTLTTTDLAGNVGTLAKTITLNAASELELSPGLVAAIVIPAIWVPALALYLMRVRRKRKKV